MKGLPAFENLETYEANPCCALSQGILSNPKIENLSIINHIVAVGISFNLKSLKIKISDPSKFNLEAFRTSSVDKLIVEIYENRNKGSHPPFEDDLRNLASKVTEIVFKYYDSDGYHENPQRQLFTGLLESIFSCNTELKVI